MPLYNEETITETTSKTRYEYAYNIEVQNFIDSVPKVVFKTAQAERDNETGKEDLLEYLRTLEETYDGNEIFDLLNPTNGSVVGTMDYDTLFAAMYSLFFHVATKVDSNV